MGNTSKKDSQPAKFNSTQYNSIQINSIRFNSIEFDSVQINSFQFNYSIHDTQRRSTLLSISLDIFASAARMGKHIDRECCRRSSTKLPSHGKHKCKNEGFAKKPTHIAHYRKFTKKPNARSAPDNSSKKQHAIKPLSPKTPAAMTSVQLTALNELECMTHNMYIHIYTYK